MSLARLWIPVLALGLAGPAGAADSWQRPQTDYAADTVMQSDAGEIRGRVWASGDKERRELAMQGRRHVLIVRRDRGVTWTLLPEQRMYVESALGEAGLPAAGVGGDVTREALGRETVNGTSTTKYRVHGTAADDTPFEGTMWMTEQEIPMRVVAEQGGASVRMELSNLTTGAVDPARFKIPAGYRRFELPAAAKADLQALQKRRDR